MNLKNCIWRKGKNYFAIYKIVLICLFTWFSAPLGNWRWKDTKTMSPCPSVMSKVDYSGKIWALRYGCFQEQPGSGNEGNTSRKQQLAQLSFCHFICEAESDSVPHTRNSPQKSEQFTRRAVETHSGSKAGCTSLWLNHPGRQEPHWGPVTPKCYFFLSYIRTHL